MRPAALSSTVQRTAAERESGQGGRMRRRTSLFWRNGLLLLVGLAELLSGLAVGHGLLIAGGLMVTTASLIDRT